MVEVAFGLPFAILIFRAFMGSIPRELDEAAIIDGASPLRVFFSIILPLLAPGYGDGDRRAGGCHLQRLRRAACTSCPAQENVTAQLTLFSFMSQFSSQWNLLFADVLIITMLPLIMFLFFQRQIVAGADIRSDQGIAGSRLRPSAAAMYDRPRDH